MGLNVRNCILSRLPMGAKLCTVHGFRTAQPGPAAGNYCTPMIRQVIRSDGFSVPCFTGRAA